MGDILDRGSMLFASLAVLAVSLVLRGGTGLSLPFRFYTPLLLLAVFYVPGLLLLAAVVARAGRVATLFERDYATLVTCAAMAWTAAHLPLVLAAWTVPPPIFGLLALLCQAWFAVLMFFAVRTVFGSGNGASAAIVALSWLPLVVAAFAWGFLSFVLGWLASPFFLFYLIYFLRSEFSGLGAGLRSRQSFRRSLEAASINPHDGEAQYQLGLIHQERRQYAEAVRRFERAVEIDPTETDAHFQLGRIARRQGRLDEALARFETVLRLDEKHSSGEAHRELGAVYLALGRAVDAHRELSIYTERRPYDPEGLYYYGQALAAGGDAARAREMYARAVEADRTAPRYRRRYTAPWSRLAQKEL